MRVGTWVDDAACRGQLDLFFPHNANDHNERRKIHRAIAICRTCPVIEQCRHYATTNREKYGIWAGLTAEQLRRTRNEHGA